MNVTEIQSNLLHLAKSFAVFIVPPVVKVNVANHLMADFRCQTDFPQSVRAPLRLTPAHEGLQI
jgi:hypothetical protein